MLILDEGGPVQFKFGECWQHEYRIGDRIVFGDDKTGERGRYEISGIRGSRGAHEFYVLMFEDGAIVAARKIDEAEFDRLYNAEQE